MDAVPPERPTRRGFFLVDLAFALEAAGRVDEARAALEEARSLAELKGNIGLMRVVDRRLQPLMAASRSPRPL